MPHTYTWCTKIEGVFACLVTPYKHITIIKISRILLFEMKECRRHHHRVLKRLVYDREEFTGHENVAYQDV